MSTRDGADRVSAPYRGVCDGCPSGRPQLVRRYTGSWGTAVTCTHHATHTD